ncbi:MAG TPA: DUF4258 domain-containing protein [Phototrophicaceae bacterium]|jgi:hypothetical protein|nr:DUF4258 domain-containing protein [Phototrophicaceae bacterium]
MDHEYKNVVFTDHAIERLKLRRITQDMVVNTLKKPEHQEPEADGDTKFTRKIQNRHVQVVSRYLPDEKKWLVISAWVRGEEDPQPVWKQLLSFIWRSIRGLLSGSGESSNNRSRR